jgi:hypothetical protein
MKDISLKGIAIGVVVVLILDGAFGIGLGFIFAQDFSPDAYEMMYKETKPLLLALFFGIVATIAGGLTAAYYKKDAPYKNAFFIGALGFISGLFFLDEYPIWFNLVGFLTVIPAALLGAYFVAYKNKH